MKALIVDDERLARSELKRLLSEHGDIQVVAEAKNVLEAETALRSGNVELLFLDVHMPGGSGFDLLDRVEDLPIVIFTSAYDQHAVRAGLGLRPRGHPDVHGGQQVGPAR